MEKSEAGTLSQYRIAFLQNATFMAAIPFLSPSHLVSVDAHPLHFSALVPFITPHVTSHKP
jgi:hypothetical protein